MKNRRVVALLIETSNAYARGLLAGIVRYVREQHRPWSIHLPEQGRGDSPPDWLSAWRGHGIIARIENARIAGAVKRTGLPVIDVSAARHVPDVAWVETDDAEISRMAAEHLLERGFRHLAYCGDSAFNWSNWRYEHFARCCAEHGAECHAFGAGPAARTRLDGVAERRALAAWVSRLPRPVGIMACYDIRAQQLLDVCRGLEIAVPEEVAVIGVDNDELLCNLSFPPLSSVIPDTQQTGFEAASLLDDLMLGKRVPAEGHFIKPLGVAARQSTDVLAIGDPEVAAALRYIREHACDGINVRDVLGAVQVSRRALDKRFQQFLGRTPHEELVRLRIERIKQLLVETNLSLAVIAERTGFRHVEYLSAAFKKHVGCPPREYRAANTPKGEMTNV